MNEHYLKNVLEAALLAAGRPLSLGELVQLFEERAPPTTAEVRAALATLAQDCEQRPIELRETASGYRLQIRRDYAAEVSRLWPERPRRYSRALLETLSLIAYRQPITRAEIEAVRGVAVNPDIVKTVIERGWVRVLGHRDLPGRPELLGTTREFLDYFGLKSIDELPPLAELRSLVDADPQLALPGTERAGAGNEAGSGAEAAELPAIETAGDDGGDGDDELVAPGAPASGSALVAAPRNFDD